MEVLLIREDNKQIKVYQSKWNREVGEVLNFDGVKFKVIGTKAEIMKDGLDSKYSLKNYVALFQSSLFEMYKY